jgi:ankyrin repeat protein
MTTDPARALHAAVQAGDSNQVRTLLASHPSLARRLDEPLAANFDQPPLLIAVDRNDRAMADALLDAGANINARSRWWAGSFGVLDFAKPDLVPHLLERGATIDVHSASRLAMRDKLEALLDSNPALVQARGGDGQTPLHFASSVEIAGLLLERGANIDARCVDHESTPAQYMVGDRLEIARFLVSQGCWTDLLMGAALGDLALVRKHLDANPASIRTRVSDRFFPKQNPHSGGTIYRWTLGADKSAHAVARDRDHLDVLAELTARSSPDLLLVVAGAAGDEAAMRQLLAADPKLLSALSAEDLATLANAARNNENTPVRAMVAAGWPVDARGQHNATPLHWAAWNGNAEMAGDLIAGGAPIDVRGDQYDGTPLTWAIYGSVHGWRSATGDYAGTVERLLAAGAAAPRLTPQLEASDSVRAVLARQA